MKTVLAGVRVALKDILFLTDFSEPSEGALPFALAVARAFGAKVHALHVLMPGPYFYTTPETVAIAIEAQEENAQAEMQRIEAQLTGVPHDVSVVHGAGIVPAVEQAIADGSADLIVLGTHGRTGAQKLLLGSVAEEIFRRAQIPVLTIGPWARSGAHNGAHFQRILFATDFTPESLAGIPYAVSFAQENQARLLLLHVARPHGPGAEHGPGELPVADLLVELHKLVPADAELWCRPEAFVEYGEPGGRILQVATDYNADLIVLGVRSAAGNLGAATHLGRAIAHRIVAHAKCPVLTVRG